jgi:hypothetical protein
MSNRDDRHYDTVPHGTFVAHAVQDSPFSEPVTAISRNAFLQQCHFRQRSS